MAFPREPEESYRPIPSDAEIRRRAAANDSLSEPSRLDNELQPDLEMTEGPASGARVGAYMIVALLIVIGVLYGVNHQTRETASNPPPATTNTAANTPAPNPPPVRNVTPGPNTQPGTTTGAAPAAPQQPATPAPNGATH